MNCPGGKRNQLQRHPDKLKDGSPRHHPLPPAYDLGMQATWETTYSTAYAARHEPPRPGSPRHQANQRVSPFIYAAVFNRDPREPTGSPRGLPLEARTKTRGAASTPTAADWAQATETLLPTTSAVPLGPPTQSLKCAALAPAPPKPLGLGCARLGGGLFTSHARSCAHAHTLTSSCTDCNSQTMSSS